MDAIVIETLKDDVQQGPASSAAARLPGSEARHLAASGRRVDAGSNRGPAQGCTAGAGLDEAPRCRGGTADARLGPSHGAA